MNHSSPWFALPQRWLHIQLPGYREIPGCHTYVGSPLEELPPIPIKLDDECAWLMEHGKAYRHDGLNQYEREILPAAVEALALEAHLELPRSFLRFMTSPNLQSRVRSCTDCYLDPGERIVETMGSLRGQLIHFLSDSQFCAHWYLHIISDGNTAVLESPDPYGYKIENSNWIENPFCRLERIDLRGLEFAYCAPSFSDFLYRFWIENEIWYALRHGASRRPLNSLELEYVGHYGPKRTS